MVYGGSPGLQMNFPYKETVIFVQIGVIEIWARNISTYEAVCFVSSAVHAGFLYDDVLEREYLRNRCLQGTIFSIFLIEIIISLILNNFKLIR